MQFRITVATAIFLLCTSVSAQFVTVELAHEIPLSGFIVPVTQYGTLNYRACADCELFSSRLTPSTRYIINDDDVLLQEFRARVTSVLDSSEHTLTILQHLESNTVTFVSIRI